MRGLTPVASDPWTHLEDFEGSAGVGRVDIAEIDAMNALCAPPHADVYRNPAAVYHSRGEQSSAVRAGLTRCHSRQIMGDGIRSEWPAPDAPPQATQPPRRSNRREPCWGDPCLMVIRPREQ